MTNSKYTADEQLSLQFKADSNMPIIPSYIVEKKQFMFRNGDFQHYQRHTIYGTAFEITGNQKEKRRLAKDDFCFLLAKYLKDGQQAATL